MSGSIARMTPASLPAVFELEFDCCSPGSLNVGRKAAGVPSAVNQEFIHSPLMLATRNFGMMCSRVVTAALAIRLGVQGSGTRFLNDPASHSQRIRDDRHH